MDLHFHIQTPEGKSEPATFPAELSVQQLITEFVTTDKMRIQPPDPEQWDLIDEDTGEQLDPKKSLHHNGVHDGHRLKLTRRKGTGPSRPEPIEPDRPAEPGGSRVLTRCENGHYFDPKKHTKCPFCGVAAIRFEHSLKLGSSSDEHTRPAGVPIPASSKVGDDAVTRPCNSYRTRPESILWWAGWLPSVDLRKVRTIGSAARTTLLAARRTCTSAFPAMNPSPGRSTPSSPLIRKGMRFI